MEPIGTILAFIAAVAAERLVEYALEKFVQITWRILVEWFKKKRAGWLNYIKRLILNQGANQEDYLFVTVKIKLQSGEIVIVQGLFNENTQDFSEARVLEYESLESQVNNVHRRQKVVVWNDQL